MADSAGSAFISYTRQGGSDCAKRLHALFRKNGIEVWQDRTHMIAGVDFWRQIERAIESCSHLVMVLTPDAFEGDRRILRQEWYTARRVGTCVVPVMGSPDMQADDDRLPRWLPSHHIYNLENESDKLIVQLQMPCTVERIPFMVDDLPMNFVARPAEHEAMIGRLLDERQEAALALTASLHGGPGFGKTTLAQALCHDDRIISAFKDGILWITLGEEDGPREHHIEKKLAALYAALTGERPAFVDKDDVANELAGKLQYKRCLIVVDDVWSLSDLKPFLRGAENCARLITTRSRAISAQAGAVALDVDEMKPAEAVQLLAAGMNAPEIGSARLREIARRLGEWPILINLFAGHVRECTLEGMSAVDAIEHLLSVLEKLGITALDRADESIRSLAVEATLAASIERLSTVESALLFDLAVFPEDVDIPIAVVAELWQLDTTASIERLRRLANLGLLRLNLAAAVVGVHDVIRRYLVQHHEGLGAAHARLLSAWPDRANLPHDYAWRRLTWHLGAAGRSGELRELLTSFDWLQAKLEATEIGELIADYDLLPDEDPLRLVQKAMRLAAYCLFADKAQLAGQLLGRLRPGIHPDLDAILSAARQWRGKPWLRPLRPTLHAPGGPLVRVLRGYAGGHQGTVRSIAIDGDGSWAVSAGNSHPDRCVFIWNLSTGTHRRLDGQAEAGSCTPLAITNDGEVFVSSFGDEVRIWSVVEGVQTGTLPACGSRIKALAISDDGKHLVAGCEDGSVIYSQPETRNLIRLGGHAAPVEAVAVHENGSCAVSINSRDARRWDLINGVETNHWFTPGFNPYNYSRCLRLSETGRYVGWGGYPKAVRRKDSATFRGHHSVIVYDSSEHAAHVMVSHREAKAVLSFSSEGRRVLVACADKEAFREDGLGLLTIEEPPRLIPLTEVGRGVSCAAISRQGRWALSADYEHDLMLWDLDLASEQPEPGAAAGVEWKGLAFDGFSSDGRFAVFGIDTDRPFAFDVSTEAPAPKSRRTAAVIKAMRERRAEPDDSPRQIPGSLKLEASRGIWKIELTRKATGRIAEGRGHTGAVFGAAVSQDERLDATVSEDGTVRVWDRIEIRQLAVFSDETIFHACRWSDDGRTLAATDYRGKTHLLRIEGVEEPESPKPRAGRAKRRTRRPGRPKGGARASKPTGKSLSE